jgi:hypothetical protein
MSTPKRRRLREKVQRLSEEKMDNLRSIEALSRQELHRARSISNFYGGIRLAGRVRDIVKVVGRDAADIVGADKGENRLEVTVGGCTHALCVNLLATHSPSTVMLYVLDPPIVGSSGGDVGGKSRVWTLQSMGNKLDDTLNTTIGREGRTEVIEAQLLQSGPVGECALRRERVEIEAGER